MEPVKKIDDAQEYEEVFQKYLEICNQAIEQNKHKFPYTEIWGARLKALEEEMKVEAIVFDDRPKLAYMLRLTKNMKIEIVEKKAIPPQEAGRLPTSISSVWWIIRKNISKTRQGLNGAG